MGFFFSASITWVSISAWGHGPHIVLHALHRAALFRLSHQSIQQVVHFAARVGKKSEDWRELHARVAHQLQPVLDRAGIRLLVRDHLALTEWAQPHQREEPAAMKRAISPLVGLRIRVQRRPLVALEDPRRQPRLKRRVRPLIHLIRPTVFGGRYGRSTVTMLFGCRCCNAAFCASLSTSYGGAIRFGQVAELAAYRMAVNGRIWATNAPMRATASAGRRLAIARSAG
jgi:hypothetical protein